MTPQETISKPDQLAERLRERAIEQSPVRPILADELSQAADEIQRLTALWENEPQSRKALRIARNIEAERRLSAEAALTRMENKGNSASQSQPLDAEAGPLSANAEPSAAELAAVIRQATIDYRGGAAGVDDSRSEFTAKRLHAHLFAKAPAS